MQLASRGRHVIAGAIFRRTCDAIHPARHLIESLLRHQQSFENVRSRKASVEASHSHRRVQQAQLHIRSDLLGCPAKAFLETRKPSIVGAECEGSIPQLSKEIGVVSQAHRAVKTAQTSALRAGHCTEAQPQERESLPLTYWHPSGAPDVSPCLEVAGALFRPVVR